MSKEMIIIDTSDIFEAVGLPGIENEAPLSAADQQWIDSINPQLVPADKSKPHLGMMIAGAAMATLSVVSMFPHIAEAKQAPIPAPTAEECASKTHVVTYAMSMETFMARCHKTPQQIRAIRRANRTKFPNEGITVDVPVGATAYNTSLDDYFGQKFPVLKAEPLPTVAGLGKMMQRLPDGVAPSPVVFQYNVDPTSPKLKELVTMIQLRRFYTHSNDGSITEWKKYWDSLQRTHIDSHMTAAQNIQILHDLGATDAELFDLPVIAKLETGGLLGSVGDIGKIVKPLSSKNPYHWVMSDAEQPTGIAGVGEYQFDIALLKPADAEFASWLLHDAIGQNAEAKKRYERPRSGGPKQWMAWTKAKPELKAQAQLEVELTLELMGL